MTTIKTDPKTNLMVGENAAMDGTYVLRSFSSNGDQDVIVITPLQLAEVFYDVASLEKKKTAAGTRKRTILNIVMDELVKLIGELNSQ